LMLKKSRVDGKGADEFLELGSHKFCKDSHAANLRGSESTGRDVTLLRLQWWKGAVRGATREIFLPVPARFFQDFVQRSRQLTGPAFVFPGQQFVLLLENVVFVSDIERGQHRQTQGIDGGGLLSHV